MRIMKLLAIAEMGVEYYQAKILNLISNYPEIIPMRILNDTVNLKKIFI